MSLNLSKHLYVKDKIVIGGSLTALLYAYSNSLPVIFTEPREPFIFDKFNSNFDFSFLGLEKGIEYRKDLIWQRILFLLSLDGKVPLSDKTNFIRIQDNILKVITEYNRVIKIKFNKLYIFDDNNLRGLPRIINTINKKNIVYDWLNIRKGGNIKLDYIYNNSDFINEVFFFYSERTGNNVYKDAVVVSYLEDKEINNFDFSDTIVRMNIEKLLISEGFSKINKIEAAEREIIQRKIRIYDNDERFEFRYDTSEEIITNFSPPSGYLSNLARHL